jgi:hypothetical protein
MSDSPRYPGPPWRPFLALALTGASFCYFTSVWKRHTLPLQAAYLNDYLRVSVGAADLPVKYTLIYAGNRRNESDEARNGRLLRGPRLISQWRFNLPMLFNKKNRGFYIETK